MFTLFPITTRNILFVVILLSGCITGCDNALQNTPARSFNSNFILTEDMLLEQKTRADRGDGEAAMKVFDHYEFGFNDHIKSRPYLLLARKAGNKRAESFFDDNKME